MFLKKCFMETIFANDSYSHLERAFFHGENACY